MAAHILPFLSSEYTRPKKPAVRILSPGPQRAELHFDRFQFDTRRRPRRPVAGPEEAPWNKNC